MKKEKITVLHIINSAQHGGGTRHLLDLVKGLSRKEYIFCIAISEDGPYVEFFRKNGFQVHIVDMMSGRFQSKAVKKLNNLIETIKPSIIHAHGTRAGFFIARGRKNRPEIPFVYTVHGLSYNKNTGLWIRIFYRQIERYICGKADKIISVSPTDGKEMVENEIADKKKVTVIENGIDLARFTRISRTYKNCKIIGCIARLTEQKGIEFLIEALAILKYVFENDLRLIIVGDGKLNNKLKKLAEKMGVTDRIEWTGATDDPVYWYKKFDIFVLPSLWEGLPLVLIEAMASGLPVISTNTSGGIDIIKDHNNGILVPRGDSEALAIAVQEIYEKKALAKKLASNGRKDSEKKYSMKRFLEQTDGFYKKTVNSK